ncbi:D-alanyl-D-alanine carboxypeptidase/D-alanyl-D-alanine-endopeptidase [candidate division WOR-3 bacterium]|nr:D-alanyl-D-alanine carboxypeptidase/D-alanyl-D-alanine-endopeptidase [candidate division WOR-3 bacterium]
MIVLLFVSILSIDSILTPPELSNAQYGICVLDLSNDRVVYVRNSQKLLVPASNMKIITTGASLCFLGPEYRFKTMLAINGKIKKNKLHGDIIITGGGDPTFSLENLEQFVLTIKKHKIKEITGNIILDDSYFTDISLNGNSFTFERLPIGWAWHYLDARYAPEISALSMNKNCVNVKMKSTKPGDYADVTIEPETDYVRLINNMITKQGEDSIIILRRPEANVIYVDGGIGENHKKDIEVTVKDPAMFMGQYFKERLLYTNIKLHGNVLKKSDTKFSTTDSSNAGIIIDSVISVSLIEILKETNIESVNLYAEILVKTLGARYYEEGSFRAGIRVLKRFLRMCGVDTNAVSLWDGSGLSRHNLVSPYQLALVLRFMYRSKFSGTFYELLPKAGVGTLEYRFNDFEGIMRAKTGSLHAVTCLSGYLCIDETDYCFSMMFNNFTCKRKRIEQIQEQIIRVIEGQLSTKNNVKLLMINVK